MMSPHVSADASERYLARPVPAAVGRAETVACSFRLRNDRAYERGAAMSLRFRRSIPLLPGIKLNLSKKTLSASVGTRGLWYTANSAGQRRFTAGLPGTGLSWTKQFPNPAPLPMQVITLVALFAVIFLVIAYAFAG
jgi:hypothetical protein